MFFFVSSVTVSNLNSLATCTFEDFLCRLPRFKEYDDKSQLNTIKYIAVAYAFMVTMIAYITGFLPGVMESALITSSATTGPLIGVFLLVKYLPLSITQQYVIFIDIVIFSPFKNSNHSIDQAMLIPMANGWVNISSNSQSISTQVYYFDHQIYREFR